MNELLRANFVTSSSDESRAANERVSVYSGNEENSEDGNIIFIKFPFYVYEYFICSMLIHILEAMLLQVFRIKFSARRKNILIIVNNYF